MKFTDGYWQVREGLHLQNPIEIRDMKIDANSITTFSATKVVRTKGDTLNATLLTQKFSSPIPDVIKVQFYRHIGKAQKGPEFEIHNIEGHQVGIKQNEEQAIFTTGRLSVRIGKTDGKIHYYYDNNRITGSNNKGPAHIETLDSSGITYVREQLDLGLGEYIYGLGERFTPFVKNGQVVDIWNEDGGTSSEQAYKNVPFYLSNKGYGVFVNHPEKVSYEVASEVVSKVQFSVEGEYLEYYIVGGETPKDVLNNFTTLTGKPALPPAWSFGLWLTTSFTTSYDENTVNSFIDGMSDRDLPLHVFHFDCFWMKEYEWCGFEWDKDVFPDPEGMIKRLKARGLKICVWINPYIAQKSDMFKEGMDNGYFVMTKEMNIWQWDKWQAGMGLVDFTNPAAVKWYQGKLKQLMDIGVDCFKTDFGERIPTDVIYHDGSDPIKMHNYYTHLYNKAVFDLLEEELGKNQAMLFARSATAGGQQFPVHWGGDCSSNYESMAETLRGGLSLGLSGFGFWSHDISGFEKTAPPDVYKRWVAFGLLSSHSRLHGNESYRVPWLFGEEAVDVLRFFTKLKCSLMPYLFSKAVEATVKGTPMMRAMVLEFNNDPTCDHLDRQYMLGDSLLVAPIFNEQGEARYYVPEGRWTDYLSGETVEGGRWIRQEYDFFSLPLLVRPNSIIAVGNENTRPDYDFAESVNLQLFELQEGAVAEAEVFNMNGELELQVRAERTNGTIRIVTEGSGKPWSLTLRGLSDIASVEGATMEKDAQGVILTPEQGVSVLNIRL
jgi:alpha-D-xyloside xylohydrolase